MGGDTPQRSWLERHIVSVVVGLTAVSSLLIGVMLGSRSSDADGIATAATVDATAVAASLPSTDPSDNTTQDATTIQIPVTTYATLPPPAELPTYVTGYSVIYQLTDGTFIDLEAGQMCAFDECEAPHLFFFGVTNQSGLGGIAWFQPMGFTSVSSMPSADFDLCSDNSPPQDQGLQLAELDQEGIALAPYCVGFGSGERYAIVSFNNRLGDGIDLIVLTADAPGFNQ